MMPSHLLKPGSGASAHQRGVSLVEVLVALLVVSLGMMAMVGLLGTASRFGKTSEFGSVRISVCEAVF